MDLKDLYKARHISSLKDIFTKHSQNLNAERHEKRRELLWGSRIALEEAENEKSKPIVKKKNPRVEMLLKWKAEKMKKLEEEKKKRKPVFKVGVVQRKATGSPIIKEPNISIKKNTIAQNTKPKINITEPKRTGVLTRAKAKNLASKPNLAEVEKPLKPFTKCYKYEGGERKEITSNVFKVPKAVARLPCSGLTLPCSPKLTKSRKSLRLAGKEKTFSMNFLNEENDKKKLEEKGEKVKEEGKGFSMDVKENHTKKAEEKVKEDKGFSMDVKENHTKPEEKEEKVKEQERTEENVTKIDLQVSKGTPEAFTIAKDDYVPIHYSPFVTVRSGKKSKRKSKKSLTFDFDEHIMKEENEFKCRIFSFRKYIECETKRLLVTCEKWKKIYEEFDEVPTDVEGDIDSVIGKTNLLTSDKFMQFKGLIDKCENGDPFVKIDDLQGFQDWVSIEVERIDDEFLKLEERKCNNWETKTTTVVVAKPQKIVKNVTKKVVGKSNIRSHILAARKLLKEGNSKGGDGILVPSPTIEVLKPVTPKKKESLLKDVLNSETKKLNWSSSKKSPVVKEKRNSGLEIMFATQKNKFPTPVKLQKSPCLTDFEIVMGTENTPSRSILKKAPKTLNSSKGHVTFESPKENKRGRGLSEKYFQPLIDDEMSPMRTILGDLENLTVTGMSTRSKTRQRSFSSLVNQSIN